MRGRASAPHAESVVLDATILSSIPDSRIFVASLSRFSCHPFPGWQLLIKVSSAEKKKSKKKIGLRVAVTLFS